MAVSGDRVCDFALPAAAQRVEAVFVNGVPQLEGRDYRVEDGRVRFRRPLRRSSGIGLSGWVLTALCASVDSVGDSVDAIVVTRSGRTSVTLQPA